MAASSLKRQVAVTLGYAAVTTVALFALQAAYGTYAAIHNQPTEPLVGDAVAEVKRQQIAKLRHGPLDIERAMQQLTQGRPALIAPQPSTDPAPAAGWMHHPEYEAPPPPLPVIPEEPEVPEPVEDSETEEATGPEAAP